MTTGPRHQSGRRTIGPTQRELDVLELIAQGYTNPEIGRKLNLSEETVKSHVRHLLSKLRARNRAHIVSKAFAGGWLRIPSPERRSGPTQRVRTRFDAG